MDRLRSMSNVEHLTHLTFDTFRPEGYGLPPDQASSLRLAFGLAEQFAEAPEGWLVLFGGYGSGKTHLAAAIANRALERGYPVLFVVVPDLLDHLRSAFGPSSLARFDERFEDVRNAPLLILDDLGTQSGTAWAQEKLFQLLNHRYMAKLPTVITSNQSPEEIDLRIRSRMEDPGLVARVEIRAPDFRRGGTYQDRSGLSSLGLLKELDFDSFDLREDDLPAEQAMSLRQAYETCREYATSPEGWLVLTGVFGCGKTHLAAAMANRQTQLGRTALFVVVPDLLDHLRATFSPNSQVRFDRRFEEVRAAPFLVLDDLGTETTSPWAQEKLFQLINHRYAARLPTVFTTSLKIEQVEPRIRTRMLDLGVCRVLGINAPNYRGTAQRKAQRQSRTRSRKGA
jgi:DNA replication protein DnaC